MSTDLTRKLSHLPKLPGVYLMKDRTGRILYVGKAKRLDHRVRSYFSGTADHPKLVALVKRIVDIDFIATGSEVDALILEMTLIKEKRPAYNINLKDDKRFPFVKVTVAEPFPRIFLTRRVKEDGARYFGPYTDVRALRQTLRTLRTLFPVRSCMGDRPGRGPQFRECLDYYIHRCLAPCIDACAAEDYRRAVEEICLFLAGSGDKVLERLRGEMDGHADRLEFEAASRARDRIALVERMLRRQQMVDVQKRDTDLFAVNRDGDVAYGVVLQIREGKVLGKERKTLKGTADRTEAEIQSAFILQYYMRADTIPPQVVASVEPDDRKLMEDWLSRKAGRSVNIRVPKKGPLMRLIRVALQNARLDLEEGQGHKRRRTISPAVYDLQTVLGLRLPPVRIECFDISNIQGSHPVASLVVMVNGEPARAEYRRFRMKTPGPDDFAMMREVVGRRAARITANEVPSPDLIVIDGGKGQVGAALEALTEAGLVHVAVIGLAKREEEIHRPGQDTPIRLPRTSPALKLLIQLRDEAHRFAVRYHRSLRGKAALKSRLDDIPGIGAQRRVSLLQYFGSFEAVEQASEAELAQAPGFGPSTARRIFQALHGERAAS